MGWGLAISLLSIRCPAFMVGPFFAPYCFGIQRRPPRRLSHGLLIHHRLVIDTGPFIQP